MHLVSYFRRHWAAPDRRHPCRPVLEGLEDRCLLSGGFTQVNLASDVPGVARVRDPNLVNPWGLTFSPTGPFWFADNGSGRSDLLDGRGQPVPLVVTIPSAATRMDGTPTGTVFNAGPGFVISENGLSAPSRFLFAGEDGTLSGWNGVIDPSQALPVVVNRSTGAVYKGLALATDPAGHSFLYAADFGRGTIDVFDQQFQPVVHPGAFEDPNLPAGFAPFNIQAIGNQLFVTYAQPDAARYDAVSGAGQGFLDIYDTDGNLVRRFASQGALDAPWGLALAPAGFGPFGGALLVGNNGDGHISAYDPGSGVFLGQLADDSGNPITIPGLWALAFGNGHAGGASDTLFFTAGSDGETHGLFGAIQDPQRRGADTGGPGRFDPHAPGEPGDYPLPPNAGPAFRGSPADRSQPIAVLLPLTESSLVLVPTLSQVPLAAPRPGVGPAADAGVPAAVVAAFVNQPGPATLASGALFLLPGNDVPQPQEDTPNNASLNSFLDLNAAPYAPEKKPRREQPDINLAAQDAGRSAAVLLPGTEVRLAGSREEQGPGSPLLPDQAGKAEARAPSASSESADQPATGGKRVAARNRASRTTLVRGLLLVVSSSLIWGHFQWPRGRSQRPASGSDTER